MCSYDLPFFEVYYDGSAGTMIFKVSPLKLGYILQQAHTTHTRTFTVTRLLVSDRETGNAVSFPMSNPRRTHPQATRMEPKLK